MFTNCMHVFYDFFKSKKKERKSRVILELTRGNIRLQNREISVID